jgi:hypothetical protein
MNRREFNRKFFRPQWKISKPIYRVMLPDEDGHDIFLEAFECGVEAVRYQLAHYDNVGGPLPYIERARFTVKGQLKQEETDDQS